MDGDGVKQSLRKNWFWLALVISVLFGYTYGKDRALRDNRVDASALQAPSISP